MFRVPRTFFSALQTAAAVLIAGCVSGADAQRPASASVIPAVAEIETAEGAFRVAAGTRLQVSPAPGVEHVARYFVDLVARTRGLPLELLVDGSAPQAGAIVFRLDPAMPAMHPEGYELAVSPEGVTLAAREPRGLFYGAVTLWQLITSDGEDRGAASLRSMVVRDAPRFVWRGFMLDVARHYMPPEFVKQMIDWMALHKLNTLHWHLTDDQGWRLQILKYPRLTEVGAWRTPAGAAAGGGKYGGYYTQDEVRDIVRYAAGRFITIVPEIDMPGHAQAAIAAYPSLGTRGPPPPVSADWGVHTYLYNVEEDTFAFLENVLAEVIELFPGAYVHVGGDEAVKDRWIASPGVQRRMRELGIADETQLQSYFIGRIEQFVRSKGRKLIGWDEILEGGLPPAATVMSWRGPEGAIEAARGGHDVVMAAVPTLYLDYLQSDSRDEPPGRPTYVTLEDVYAFEPVPPGLNAAEESHILGAQANAWTEHMRTAGRIQHDAFPRVAALAEVLWSPRSARNWRSFVDRLPAQFGRYEALGIGYADAAFEARFTVSQDSRGDSIRVQLSNQVGEGEIRYTLDAGEPDTTSPVYAEPLVLDLPARISAATFMDGRRVSAPRTRAFDAAMLRGRTDDELQMCTRKLVLRLEDDAPLEGARAIFNIDIMDPCWIYEGANLSGVSRITAAVGQLPFNFQIGVDARKIPLRAPRSPHGELEVRLDRCDGEIIAVLPLAPAAARDDVTALAPVSIGDRQGRHDLCLTFTRSALEPMWAIDRVELLE